MRTDNFGYPALILAMTLTMTLTAGCGGDAQEREPAGVIPEYQLKALQKAQGVEDQLQESVQQRTEQVDGE